MPTATAPPLIAPGIVCPKCKGPMLDERAAKRSDKSPDYTCANLTCVSSKNGKSYRTAIWAEKSSGAETAAGVSPPANVGAPPAEPPAEKPKLTGLYKQATEFVLKEIVPLYEKAEIGLSDETVAACVQTLFIAAAKER